MKTPVPFNAAACRFLCNAVRDACLKNRIYPGDVWNGGKTSTAANVRYALAVLLAQELVIDRRPRNGKASAVALATQQRIDSGWNRPSATNIAYLLNIDHSTITHAEENEERILAIARGALAVRGRVLKVPGVRRKRGARWSWPDERIEKLRAVPHLTHGEAAKFLGSTRHGVYSARRRYGLHEEYMQVHADKRKRKKGEGRPETTLGRKTATERKARRLLDESEYLERVRMARRLGVA